MIFSQPVVYEFPRIRVPTTLMIGQRDRTAIGRDLASPELAERLGDYPELGKRAARLIRNSRLGEFEDRQSVVEGERVSVRVDLGGRRIITKHNKQEQHDNSEDITHIKDCA